MSRRGRPVWLEDTHRECVQKGFETLGMYVIQKLERQSWSRR